MENVNQYVIENWMLFVLIAAVVLTISEGLKYLMKWSRDTAQMQAENDLKREMVRRGMSPDEIVRVLRGIPSPGFAQNDQKVAARVNHLAELGKALAIQEVSAPIMEAILTHFATIPEEYQPSIYESLSEMIESSVDASALLAAVSSFSKAYAAKAKIAEESNDVVATS